jgi:hypothetical protein
MNARDTEGVSDSNLLKRMANKRGGGGFHYFRASKNDLRRSFSAKIDPIPIKRKFLANFAADYSNLVPPALACCGIVAIHPARRV